MRLCWLLQLYSESHPHLWSSVHTVSESSRGPLSVTDKHRTSKNYVSYIGLFSVGSPGPILESLTTTGLMDKSRLALCMVLFTVVLINPLSPALQDADTYTVEGGAGGRSILGTEAATGLTQLMRASSSSLLVSAFNIIILIMGKPVSQSASRPALDPSDCVWPGLIRIFVHGEPRISKGEGWSRWRKVELFK